MNKRIWSLILAAGLLISLIPSAVFAEQKKEVPSAETAGSAAEVCAEDRSEPAEEDMPGEKPAPGDEGFSVQEPVLAEEWPDNEGPLMDLDETPETTFFVNCTEGGRYSIDYEGALPTGNYVDSTSYSGAMEVTIAAGATVTLTPLPDDDMAFVAWYAADPDWPESERPYTDERITTTPVYTFTTAEGLTPRLCAVFAQPTVTSVELTYDVLPGENDLNFTISYENVTRLEYLNIEIAVTKANGDTYNREGYWDMEEKNMLGSATRKVRFVNGLNYTFDEGDTIEWRMWLDRYAGGSLIQLGPDYKGTIKVEPPENVWTVSFDVNGGNEVIEAQEVPDGRTAAKPSAPTHDEYKFRNWYILGTHDIFDFSETIHQDVALIAGWSRQQSARVYDQSTDVSTTTLKGSLKVTDKRTGEEYSEDFDRGALPSSFTDPYANDVNDEITLLNEEMDAAQVREFGDYEYTAVNKDRVVKMLNNIDNRTFSFADRSDWEHYLIETGLAVAGDYGHEWEVTEIRELEFESPETVYLCLGTTEGGSIEGEIVSPVDGNYPLIVEPDSGQNKSADYKSQVNLTAVPEEGWHLVGWYEGVRDGSGFVAGHTDTLYCDDEEYAFTIKNNIEIQAVFAKDGEQDPVEAFVIRLYDVCLNRLPDEAGLASWVSQLKQGKITGVKAAQGFIFSQEFQNRNYCNRHFVEQLYRAFMGREYDEGGLAYWINKLETGSTREAVFNGFALSPEFTKLCSDYGINRGNGIGVGKWGTVPKGPCTMMVDGAACGEEDGVTAFVKRLYAVCLDRDADAGGLANWTNQLWNHTKSGKQVAFGFVFSAEFTGKNHSNEKFVDYMYQAFFGRDPDAGGKANWVRQLNAGKSRLEVFNGFADSKEFSNLCLKYGILAA